MSNIILFINGPALEQSVQEQKKFIEQLKAEGKTIYVIGDGIKKIEKQEILAKIDEVAKKHENFDLFLYGHGRVEFKSKDLYEKSKRNNPEFYKMLKNKSELCIKKVYLENKQLKTQNELILLNKISSSNFANRQRIINSTVLLKNQILNQSISEEEADEKISALLKESQHNQRLFLQCSKKLQIKLAEANQINNEVKGINTQIASVTADIDKEVMQKTIYPMSDIENELKLEFSKEPLLLSNILKHIKSRYEDKASNITILACYGSQVHRFCTSILPKSNFVSFGQPNKAVFVKTISEIFKSYENDKAFYKGGFSFGNGNLVLAYLVKDYFNPETKPYCFVPYITRNGQFIDPEKHLAYGRDFSDAEEKQIHNRLGVLVSKEKLNQVITTLEKSQNMTSAELKEKLHPENYGISMAIGLVVNKAFAK